MTKQEFQDWKIDPRTKKFFSLLTKYRTEILDEFENAKLPDHADKALADLISMRRAASLLSKINDLDYEEMKGYDV